jgi:TolB protein
MRRFVTIAAALALLATPASAHAALPGKNGKIAFVSTRTGNYDVYTMNADGSGRTALTNDTAIDLFPTWSPDGKKIAFESTRGGGSGGDIWTMNADGSGMTRVTAIGGVGKPTWSPDGSQLAFERDAGIWTVDADGTHFAALNSEQCDPSFNCTVFAWPTWNPNGKTIAFVGKDSDDQGNSVQSDIWAIPLTGGSQTKVTSTPNLYENKPDWSPDASKIAVESFPPFGSPQVWTMSPNGFDRVQLTTGAGSNGEPAWSPDGTKIAFVTYRDGNHEIYAMNADGSGQTNLTNNGASDYEAAWQPIPYTGYPRPRGATPLRVSLVPAFKSCAAPNTSHGAPLAFGSCGPPVQASNFLTIHTPDANGGRASAVGFLLFKVKTSSPEDVLISGSITDVNCRPATDAAVCSQPNGTDGPDYSGQLQANATIRITDHYNGPGANEPATVVDLPFPVSLTCANTADTSIGGTCNVTTSGAVVCPECGVRQGERTVVEMAQVQVFDGGSDGQVATNDNTLFMDQGIFVP